MDKLEQARELFLKLESGARSGVDIARRNFEIQSRLAQ